jgi:hypothetical protein
MGIRASPRRLRSSRRGLCSRTKPAGNCASNRQHTATNWIGESADGHNTAKPDAGYGSEYDESEYNAELNQSEWDQSEQYA